MVILEIKFILTKPLDCPPQNSNSNQLHTPLKHKKTPSVYKKKGKQPRKKIYVDSRDL